MAAICSGVRGGAGDVAPGRVADHPGEIPDQEHHVVAEVLELPHLVQQNRVAEMQVRGRRVEPRLYAQRLPAGELAHQILFHDQLVGAAPDHFEMVRLSH